MHTQRSVDNGDDEIGEGGARTIRNDLAASHEDVLESFREGVNSSMFQEENWPISLDWWPDLTELDVSSMESSTVNLDESIK